MSLVLIIDDNVIEQIRLTQQLKVIGFDHVICATNVEAARAAVLKIRPDLLIADVFLQTGTSIDFVYEISIPTIFVTTTREISIYESLKDKQRFAYLVKPVETVSLLSSINLVLAQQADKKTLPEKVLNHSLAIRQGKGQYRLLASDILWLRSDGNYTHIATSTRKFVVKKSMRQTLSEVGGSFIRTHKQFNVNIDHVTNVDEDSLTINGEIIPISKRFKSSFLKAYFTKNQKVS